jgi:putative ABC transport system substrate-binding protein
MATELMPKRLELLSELVPQAGMIGLLGNPNNASAEPPASVGDALGLTIVMRDASRPDELDAAFAAAAADGDRAIVVQFSALTFEEKPRVVAVAGRFRLPAVYGLRDYVEAGGLISYGPVIKHNFERAAALVDKILRGASPADLSFEQPTDFELVVNLKSATALGLTIPPAILDFANEVIA